MEKRETSYTIGENVNWCSHYGEQCGGSLKTIKTELPSGTAILLLGIYLEKTIIEKDTCAPVFITALLKVARTWKPHKSSTAEKEYVVYIYSGLLLSHKKEQNNTICHSRDGL